MRTLTDVSPYQVSMAMRVSRDVAREMLADDSGSTYTRDVFGTRYTLDPVARTLTETYAADAADAAADDDATPADATPADVAPVYSFYVGSTPMHDAHDRNARMPRPLQGVVWDRIYGVWAGEVENVAVYQTHLPDDATAQRIAYAVAVLTHNDCVMVTRDARPGEGDRAMSSVRPYLVSEERTAEGNRTIIGGIEYGRPDANAGGYRLVPDVRGTEVAYLVCSDASVSAVQ